ncbi:MAG: ATP-binding cassette domain-containing protein [Patescibacteria group bacterium]|jgi:ATP-binding cassette subfamily F protein 3
MAEEVILRFAEVKFEYVPKKPVLSEANFLVRRGAKITLMGQNGAGKSTIFNLIRGELTPKSGQISITGGASIGYAKQVMAREYFPLTIEEYFATAFNEVPGNLKSQIAKVLEAVNFEVAYDKLVGDLSGGQQARLLLAYALIQSPDILLLDEPTNNLDQAGIDHLITFLIMYDKTVLVISHDADFLNCFTEGVIYLNNHTHQTEMYVGDYFSVVEEINRRVEKERRENAQLEKQILDRKEKVNFFAHKGGKMRKLAKKLKEETEELEESLVEVRREDRTIRPFEIPLPEISGELAQVKQIKVIINHEPILKKVDKSIRKKDKILVTGPNGIGKSTFLRSLVANNTEGQKISPGVKVGYYSQDFSTLNLEERVFDFLMSVMADGHDEPSMRSIAAGFLITGELMNQKIGDLSEGQKGLLTLASLVLMEPGLLILDEPTNHINFRHLPVIAEAINNFAGGVIMVSHMTEFVEQIKITEELDLSQLK